MLTSILRRVLLVGILVAICGGVVALAEHSEKQRTKTKQILFICTGNFYRSRFAEVWFNHRAQEMNVEWRAVSRGLKLVSSQQGISPIALHELKERGVATESLKGTPTAVSERDLKRSDIIVLMDESEHRAVFEKEFPKCDKSKIVYWHVHDSGKMETPKACQTMSKQVDKLLDSLSQKERADSAKT